MHHASPFFYPPTDAPSAWTTRRVRAFARKYATVLGVLALLVVLRALLALYVYMTHEGTYRATGPLGEPSESSMRGYGFSLPSHEANAIRPSWDGTLSTSAFPPDADVEPQPPATPMYPRGANPHLGEIPSDVMKLLASPPPLTPPPPREAVPEGNTTWRYVPWTREANGSRTQFSEVPVDDTFTEADWRPPRFRGWTPPLAELFAPPPPVPPVQHPFAAPDRPSGSAHDPARDRELERRQSLVKNAFVRSWQGYKKYAWGSDEVRPVTEQDNNNFNGWGATIIDALDTLLVMGLQDEYKYAREHVHDVSFHYLSGQRSAYGYADGRVPVFETSIRYLGGLLSAYDMTGDDLMLDRAEELAQLLLPAFETLTGLPVGRMDLNDDTEYTSEYPRGFDSSVVLAEVSSMLLEYTRLWQVTGNRTYFDRVQRVTDYLDRNMTRLSVMGTLLPTTIYPETPMLAGKYTFGGQADSYYEYLIKEHQLLGGRLPQYARMYSEAVDAGVEHLWKEVGVVPRAPSLAASAEALGSGYFTPKVEHLACFAGGMLALGARLLPKRPHDLNMARRLTETCYWAYNATATGLGPENLDFYRVDDQDRFHVLTLADGTRRRGKPAGAPLVGVRMLRGEYRGRPETIESVFYMWRTTGDLVWQERGWQMFASWMTHALLPAGVASISNVNQVPAPKMDSMESYTMAETFKYYYLLFSPPSLVSLDDFVFTTEAHPLLAPRHGTFTRPGDVPASFPPSHGPWEDLDRPRGNMTSVQRADFYEKLMSPPPTANGFAPWQPWLGDDKEQLVQSILQAYGTKSSTPSPRPVHEASELYSATVSL